MDLGAEFIKLAQEVLKNLEIFTFSKKQNEKTESAKEDDDKNKEEIAEASKLLMQFFQKVLIIIYNVFNVKEKERLEAEKAAKKKSSVDGVADSETAKNADTEVLEQEKKTTEEGNKKRKRKTIRGKEKEK